MKLYFENKKGRMKEDFFKEEYRLTNSGRKQALLFIKELKAKRKEILDAGKDTADYTTIPTLGDIEDDIEFTGVDEDGEYYNGWGVTDNYDSDYPLSLSLGIDFVNVN